MGSVVVQRPLLASDRFSVLVITFQLENVTRVESRTSHKSYVPEITEIKACNVCQGLLKEHIFQEPSTYLNY